MAVVNLTAARLREVLHYYSELGLFTNLTDRGWNSKPGMTVGTRSHKDGRKVIRIDGRNYCTNRLAWLYMNGAWPAGVVDHIDTDASNDAWLNLRDITQNANMQNQRRPPAHNTTGFLGVSFSKPCGRFRAYIKLNKKHIHLGLFDTALAAHLAYVEAKRRLHPAGTL